MAAPALSCPTDSQGKREQGAVQAVRPSERHSHSSVPLVGLFESPLASHLTELSETRLTSAGEPKERVPNLECAWQ